MNIGSAIKVHRVIRELSQIELAELAGVSGATISNIEKGSRSVSLDVFFSIAKALDAHPAMLIYFASYMSGEPLGDHDLDQKLLVKAISHLAD